MPVTRLEDLRNPKEEEAAKNNDYTALLKSGYDRVKADVNSDRKVDYDEYRNYILSTTDNKPQQVAPIIEKHSININFTIVISVIVICITAIVCANLLKKKVSK